mmetsp:Transcript_15437/g.29113  ORF Transcript_15437/g.29113 Transcript_15437/m.29113 type:complete len:326 (-) Transcript_15437:168-1145(-)
MMMYHQSNPSNEEGCSDLELRFNALLQQESSCCYRCVDYLSILQQKQYNASKQGANNDSASTQLVEQQQHVANESWRERICEWLYNVIDHFNYSREIVCITMNYLDRYASMCSQEEPQRNGHGANRMTYKLYQLIAVSSLNIVLKMHESKYNHLPLLIELSRNFFTHQHIIVMEMSILKGLSWKLSPPTPLSFMHHLIKLFPKEDLIQGNIDALKGSAQFLIELSSCDYFFVCVKPSSIAYASLLVSMDRMSSSSSKKIEAEAMKREFVKNLQEVFGLTYTEEVKQCQLQLQEIFEAGGYEHDGFYSQRALSSPVSSAVALPSST